MSKALKIMNAVAGAMGQAHEKDIKNPAKRPMGNAHETGEDQPVDHMDADRDESDGENFDLESLKKHVKDFHDAVMGLGKKRGAHRGGDM